jgi:hypothetical protein
VVAAALLSDFDGNIIEGATRHLLTIDVAIGKNRSTLWVQLSFIFFFS